eukprot:TRINITY_DN6677_c0_g1_i5.p2 TRINITY_DN6677_c0_g1~~TRINITY_DN6677_c0_g1_i5.p2  ORF type:complete len:271 (+),score=-21.67 TRINITY_DN6677_c0_g1_i5:1154-1966(+)
MVIHNNQFLIQINNFSLKQIFLRQSQIQTLVKKTIIFTQFKGNNKIEHCQNNFVRYNYIFKTWLEFEQKKSNYQKYQIIYLNKLFQRDNVLFETYPYVYISKERNVKNKYTTKQPSRLQWSFEILPFNENNLIEIQYSYIIDITILLFYINNRTTFEKSIIFIRNNYAKLPIITFNTQFDLRKGILTYRHIHSSIYTLLKLRYLHLKNQLKKKNTRKTRISFFKTQILLFKQQLINVENKIITLDDNDIIGIYTYTITIQSMEFITFQND